MERGERIDGALYCRIMFDDNISAEFPEHEEFIHQTAIPLLKSRYGIDTAIVQAERTYTDIFYSQYQSGKNIGKNYGFPMLLGPWCNSRLKVSPIRKWEKTQGEYKSVVGIAADETKRIRRQTVKGAVLPLVDYGITETEAFEICKKHDILSPAYNNGRTRLGCWFCHNQRVGELRRLRAEYPQLWEKLLVMEKDSWRTFTPKKTLRDYDNRFAAEETRKKGGD